MVKFGLVVAGSSCVVMVFGDGGGRWLYHIGLFSWLVFH